MTDTFEFISSATCEVFHDTLINCNQIMSFLFSDICFSNSHSNPHLVTALYLCVIARMFFIGIIVAVSLFYVQAVSNLNCVFNDLNNRLDLSLFRNSSIVLQYHDLATNNNYFYSPCANKLYCHIKYNGMITNQGRVDEYKYCDTLAVWDGGKTKPNLHSELEYWQFTYNTPEVSGNIAVKWHCNQTVGLQETYIISTTYINEFDYVSFTMDIASKYACKMHIR